MNPFLVALCAIFWFIFFAGLFICYLEKSGNLALVLVLMFIACVTVTGICIDSWNTIHHMPPLLEHGR